MRTVTIEALVPAADVDDVFGRISDFERYADHTDAVREIVVSPGPDGSLDSRWAVNFRSGVMCWSERDRIDQSTRSITFEQLDGDFDHFAGSWQVLVAGDDVAVRFAASFDLGMPSLAAIIDPIAERTLRENIVAILRGLLGDHLMVLDVTAEAVPGVAAER